MGLLQGHQDEKEISRGGLWSNNLPDHLREVTKQQGDKPTGMVHLDFTLQLLFLHHIPHRHMTAARE